jgi:hypothetical protein
VALRRARVASIDHFVAFDSMLRNDARTRTIMTIIAMIVSERINENPGLRGL